VGDDDEAVRLAQGRWSTYSRHDLSVGKERAFILQTLEEVRWVVGGPDGAAAKLGLKRTTLMHKMKTLRIERPARGAVRL